MNRFSWFIIVVSTIVYFALMLWITHAADAILDLLQALRNSQ